ncbi:MAG: hypothetical protein ACYSYU_06020 [Planctomycetota bacterium]|jgi:hypothetical protein
MKKIILLLVMAMFATPAMALVTIEVNDLGGGWAALEYSCTGANPVGFGLDVNVTPGVDIIDVNILHVGENDGNGVGFGIFPASFDRLIDPNDPDWNVAGYTPVADVNDPGVAGGLPGIELGALGIDAPNDGTLIEIQVDGSCTMCVNNNSSRGGVVLKRGGNGNFPGSCGVISLGPDCWNSLTQCHGDVDNDGSVGLTDFYALLDSWQQTYPAALYDPCADFDRDGSVGLTDFYTLLDNWQTSPPANCTPGGTWPP